MKADNIIFSLCLILSLQRAWSRSIESVNKSEPAIITSSDWDFIVYSQEWPATVCTEWQEHGKSNTCRFPNDKTSWTVHGVWPSKIGSRGPQQCPSEKHFDSNQLAPFMDELKQHWTDIHANSKPLAFWKQEWEKHGTCASVLPALNSVANYFRQGLEWNKQFKLSTILNEGKVSPGGRQSYDVLKIANAVKAFTKTAPTVQCVIDSHTKETLLSEIRLCFNKSLELIDCDTVMPQAERYNDVITNCKKTIMYYGVSSSSSDNVPSLLVLLSIIQIIYTTSYFYVPINK